METKKNIEVNCIFCNPQTEIITETEMAYAIFDKYPVSEGHILIIPKRHVGSYFDLSVQEHTDCSIIINKIKDMLKEKYKPDGYNIGVNIGKFAGQTIEHIHIHIIPRYKGDVINPVGGIRNVIPEKGNYLNPNRVTQVSELTKTSDGQKKFAIKKF